MKIIILGAGRIGQAIAESLMLERNDITVIDLDVRRLQDLESRYDLRGVAGNGTDPAVLAEAGAEDTNLLIACASLDETNIVCCKVAQMVFQIPLRIARVRSSAWLEGSQLLGPQGFSVDRCLRPEDSMTHYFVSLVEFPQAMQVREFAGGRAMLTVARARAAAPMVGRTIAELRALWPELPMRIVAIYRRFSHHPDRFVAAHGQTRIEPDDEVYVMTSREHAGEVLPMLTQPIEAPVPSVRRIMVVDGGVVAQKLASELTEMRKGYYNIKLVESDRERGRRIYANLPDNVLMFHAQGTDEDFLEQENIDQVDLLLALSDDDENNIMTCLLGKRMGAKRVLALINQRSYADLLHGTQIDIALTPAQAMLGELMTFVRQGNIQAVHSLRRGVAEALEVVVRGDSNTSGVVGRRIGELRLPRDVHLGLIVRGLEPAPPAAARQRAASPANGSPAGPREQEQAQGSQAENAVSAAVPDAPGRLPQPGPPQIVFPGRQTRIEPGDHLVFFVPHKRLVRDIERVFSVKPTFF